MRERKNEKTTGADEEGAVVLTGLAPVVGEAPLILILGSIVLRASRQPLLAADGAAVSGGDGSSLVSRL